MIRKFKGTDLDAVADIWLAANLEAHDFIPASYWRSHFEVVKSQLSQAELYVCEQKGEIQGFVGLCGEYIAGIFVSGEAQSQGIGKRLLDFVKGRKERLCLTVYRKNARATRFYQREGFVIQRERPDENTGEPEYEMTWA